MTAAQPIAEDGNLPAALRDLGDAIYTLCAPQQQHEDRLINAPCRYLQIQGAITGEQVNSGGGGGGKSRPPLWLDALDLVNEIDTAVEIWQPAYTGVPPTVGRLHWFLQRKWRPQDVRQLEQATGIIKSWVEAIDQLLNPEPKWTLPSPCPACQTATVYRRDGSGEMVRQPALQIGPAGCQCQRCKHTWEPSHFQLLAAALGYPLAEGVLTLPETT